MTTVLRFGLAVVVVLGCLAECWGAVTAEQRKEVAELQSALTKAGNLFKQKKFKESAEAVRQVQTGMEKLSASDDKDVVALLEPLHGRLKIAHGLLEIEGLELPPLKELKAAPAKTPDKTAATPAPAGGKTSFVSHVAPILVAKCGRCHVNDRKGMVSMATWESFAKGPPAGVLFFKGEADGSRIIEVIETGDMPRGGGKLSDAEFTTLKSWINEGAIFDGSDPKASLASLAPSTKPEVAPPPTVTQATGKESVSFARDVAPVLAKTCTVCHGTNRPRNMFNMNTFTGLLKGGDSGAPIVPGKPADSLLVKKLKGTGGGQRMPLMQAPLADEVIAKIEKWIAEGARYDAADPSQDLASVAALARAQAATHEELAADRANLANDNWRLAMPDTAANKLETKNFLLVGSTGAATLAGYGEQAEAVVPKLATFFHASSDEPLVKGKITLFFFEQRYDYSQLGQMVERRELPKEWRGHWRNNIVDAYGAVLPGKDYSTDVLLAQQIAGAYVASLGRGTPRWFPEGAARMAAAKLSPTDSRVAAWDAQLPEVFASMSKPDDFLNGKLPPEASDICSYSFVRHLMTDAKKFNGLLEALKKGDDFNKSFAASYGGTPSQVSEAWVRVALKKTPVRRPPAKK